MTENILLRLPELLDGLPIGEWVAVSEAQGRVVGHGVDLESVFASASGQGDTEPLMVRVGNPDVQMVL